MEPGEDEDKKSATASDDEGPADDESGESELEEAAASKRYFHLPNTSTPANGVLLSASSALSKVEEVDIEGGWKVGDQYVMFVLSPGVSLSYW